MLLQLLIFILIVVSVTADSCESFIHGVYGKTGRCIKMSDCPSNNYLSKLCESKPIDVKCCFNTTKSNKGCPNIISRAGWKARHAKDQTLMNTPVPFVVIHDTVSPTCKTHDVCVKRIQQIQNYHINEKNWQDIGYNFLIGENGLVYEGRGWTYVGAHRSGFNNRSIGIAMIGDYRSRKADKLAVNALESLIQCGISRHYIKFHYKTLGKQHHLA